MKAGILILIFCISAPMEGLLAMDMPDLMQVGCLDTPGSASAVDVSDGYAYLFPFAIHGLLGLEYLF